MIQLETYKGTRTRHTCPKCNSKGVFVRYQDERGEYIASDVGRCNRESKCGYHYKPKQYFADNPTGSKFVKTRVSNWTQNTNQNVTRALQNQTTAFDFIAPEHLKATLSHYDRNAFVQFLFDLFPDCSEEIQDVLKMYFVGTFDDYTCFPQIDRLNRVCKAKLIRFNRANGKRLKGRYDTSSLPAKLKLKEDFNYKQIFFGEHLLLKYPDKPVAIVEAEKTAVIASICFPEFIWLACNSKTWLKAERLQRFAQRQIILYPDADGFELWQTIATNSTRQGLSVKASSLIENFATGQQKQNQYDLADFLTNQQTEINRSNVLIDRFNSNDKAVLKDVNIILNEQKAVLLSYGDLSETEVERICTQPENLRSVALSV